MAYYILKCDNPNDPLDLGTPTRVRLIGPFETRDDARDWGADESHNPFDNPCWQVVDLDPATTTVGFDRLHETAFIQVHTPDKAAGQAADREQAYLTAHGKTPLDALRERHRLQTTSRITHTTITHIG